MRNVLDDLDDIANNVILTVDNGVARFDTTIDRELVGSGDIEVEAFGGKVTLEGHVEYSFHLALHLVFGVDAKGFFIDTNAVAGPELSLTKDRKSTRLNSSHG